MKILRVLGTRNKYGGDLFEDETFQALKTEHEIDVYDPVPENAASKIKSFPGYLQRLHDLKNFQKKFDLVIRPMNHTFFLNDNVPQIVIAYHYDCKFSSPLVAGHHWASFQTLLRNKNKIDKLVVISDFWAKYFSDLGVKNIVNIPCGFDISKYEISEEQVAAFKAKYNLEDKNVVYIGNPQKKKGAALVYEQLKNSGYFLVTSGNGDLNLPILNLKLNFTEYLCLLKASGLVVTYSQFKEGWTRVAHEALLMGTPVVGSGLGGMGDLLNICGQVIEPNPENLKWQVDSNFKNTELAIKGQKIAQTFTIESFNQKWRDVAATYR